MYKTLQVERNNAIATVWLNRPDVHNAFNETLIDELDAIVRELDADPTARVVILAGKGRNFCAGADLHWMERAAAAGREENEADARRFAAMLDRLARMSRPTIARVQGYAFGGGVGLAAACDICIAAQDTQFALSEVRLGLIPAVVCPYVLRAVGARQCLRYMQSAERIAAPRAVEIGLAHEAVPADRLDARIGEICTALLAGGPQSMAAAKALVYALDGPVPPGEIQEITASAIARQRTTEEAREGIGAFLAKRAPNWS